MDKQFRKCFLSAVVLTVIIATTVVFHYIKSPLINLTKGKKFFKQGKNLTAIAYFNLASAAEPRNKEPLLYLAFAYDKLGRNKDTLRTLEAANKIDGKDLKIKKWLADVYYSENEFAKAEKLYRQILSSQDDPNLQMRLAEVQTWQKEYGKAVMTLEQIKKRKPDNVKATKLLADVYTWNKKYDKAFELLSDLHKKYPQDNSTALQYAMILIGKHNYSEAIELCQKILESDNRNKDAKLWLARLLSWDKEYDSALQLYAELIEVNPDWITARREKARVLGWARRYDEAIAEYKKAVDLDKSNEAIRYEMFSKYNLYNRFDKAAVENYRHWLEFEPNNLEALYDLGQIYAQQVQWDNARGMYQLTLDNDSGHFRAKQALERVNIYSRLMRLETGFEYFEADSSGRTMDKRYWDVFVSVREPLNENTYISVRQDNIWRSFENFKQIYQQQFSVALDYYKKPDFWAGVNYAGSVYPDRQGLKHIFGGQLNFMPYDAWTVSLSHQREQITDTSSAFMDKLYRDNYKFRADYKPTRRLLSGLDYMYSNYSGDNQRNAYGFDIGYYLLLEPKSLKISYRYEQYGFDKEKSEYFSPNSFHYNNVNLEWRQFLNQEELYWGANDTYYTLRYEVIFDVRQQVGHKVYVDFHHDWNNNWSSHFEFSKTVYEHSDIYSEEKLMFYTSIYF